MRKLSHFIVFLTIFSCSTKNKTENGYRDISTMLSLQDLLDFQKEVSQLTDSTMKVINTDEEDLKKLYRDKELSECRVERIKEKQSFREMLFSFSDYEENIYNDVAKVTRMGRKVRKALSKKSFTVKVISCGSHNYFNRETIAIANDFSVGFRNIYESD